MIYHRQASFTCMSDQLENGGKTPAFDDEMTTTTATTITAS